MKADYDRAIIRTSRGSSHSVSVIPDSYFAVQTPKGKTHFFLELDRGTMTIKRFQSKVAAYLAYYETGAYERRYQTKSLRILTITLGEQRRANLKRATEQVGRTHWFWFGVLSELQAEKVLSAPVWQVAHSTALSPLIEAS